MLEFKICSTCKKELSLTQFHKNKHKKDGYKECCKICRKIESKKMYEKNKDRITLKNSEYVKLNKEKTTKYKRDWAKKNYDPKKRREFFLKNKEKINLNNRKRYKNDVLFKLKKCLSRRLYMAVKSNKNHSVVEYLGCDINFLKNYLESKFVTGMSWSNYGEWHIDHIIPLSISNNEQDLYKLCHYTNLQPLWKLDNIRKSNKIGEK